MKLKFMDFACVAAALTRMGYLDEDGNPTDLFYRAMAENEAEKLSEGFFEVYGGLSELDYTCGLMDDFDESGNVGALRALLAYAYDRSDTEQAEFYLLLDDDERFISFCRALACALDKLLD